MFDFVFVVLANGAVGLLVWFFTRPCTGNKIKENSDRCLSTNISAAAAVIPLRCCVA